MAPGIRWKHYVGKATQREPRKTEHKDERSAYGYTEKNGER
jgi:hypothetical protein